MKNNIHVVLWPVNTHTHSHIALTVGQAMKGVTFPQTLRHAIFLTSVFPSSQSPQTIIICNILNEEAKLLEAHNLSPPLRK